MVEDLDTQIQEALIQLFEEIGIPYNGTYVYQKAIEIAQDFEDGTAQDPNYN